MNKITPELIEATAQYSGEPVLTIYLPTHRYPTPPNIQEDQIRFKNLVREGCEKWAQVVDEQAVRKVQNQLEESLNDLSFWQDAIESMVIFAAVDKCEIYHLPIEVEEYTYVGERFDVTPLSIFKELDQPYYLFALAKHEPRLFKADRYGVEPVEIEFPASPEDALNIDEMFANSNTIREGAGPEGSKSHGQGDSSRAGEQERIQYFRILDDLIMKAKGVDQSLPVLLAATDNEAGDFIAHTQNRNLMEVFVPGNFTKATPRELHEAGWEVIEREIITTRLEKLVNRYGEMIGAQKASTDLADIKAAAEAGRVECLLLPLLDRTNDSVSDSTQESYLIRFIDEYREGEYRELVHLVLSQGGGVTAMTRDAMPDGALVGAIYRY